MIKVITVSLFTLFLTACQFNQSMHKNIVTGSTSIGKGIGCNEITIMVNGKKQQRSVFTYGEKVHLSFNNITGLTKEGNKVFPELSMHIVKNGKDTVLANPNLLNLNEGTDLIPLQLQTNFIAAVPFKNQEEYKVFIRIWDKQGDGTFTYELPFKVIEDKRLDIRSQGLDYSSIYLWDQTTGLVITDKHVQVQNTLFLILEGLKGLNTIDNHIYPSLAISIIDHAGNTLLSNTNILEEYKDSGIDSNQLSNGQLPVKIKFNPGQIVNPCQLSVSLTDTKSDKKIDIKTELEIHQN